MVRWVTESVRFALIFLEHSFLSVLSSLQLCTSPLHVEWACVQTNPHFFALSVAGRMGGADDIGTKSTWNMSFLVSHPLVMDLDSHCTSIRLILPHRPYRPHHLSSPSHISYPQWVSLDAFFFLLTTAPRFYVWFPNESKQ